MLAIFIQYEQPSSKCDKEKLGHICLTLIYTYTGNRSLQNRKYNITQACFIRRILVALNAIKTIDNEMINLIKHYPLF